LQGKGEIDQIQKIFALMGTPTNESWPEFSSLPSTGTFKWKNRDSGELSKKFQINSFSSTGQTYLDPNGFHLLSKLLSLNPKSRISAEEALKHAYFSDGVKMQVPSFFH
jgi:cell division cycle 2-like protein